MVIGGGEAGSNTNVIDYTALPTAGNASDFGDLTVARRFLACAGNFTRALWTGGFSKTTTTDFVVIQTTGNATDFGDLLENTNTPSAASGSPS